MIPDPPYHVRMRVAALVFLASISLTPARQHDMTGGLPAGSRQAGRDDAADRGAGALPGRERGRFERQPLAALGQRSLDLCQRRTTACGDDQLGRLVVDDAAVLAALCLFSDLVGYHCPVFRL